MQGRDEPGVIRDADALLGEPLAHLAAVGHGGEEAGVLRAQDSKGVEHRGQSAPDREEGRPAS